MKIKRSIYTSFFLIVACLLSSCAIDREGGSNNFTQLHTNNENGVVIFRAVFFKNLNKGLSFVKNELPLLTADSNTNHNVLFIAKKITHTKEDKNIFSIATDSFHKGKEEETKKLFTQITKEPGLFSRTNYSYKPEYFYTVRILPKGKYYIKKMYFTLSQDSNSHSYVDADYTLEDSPYLFSVEANKINYLGDLCIIATGRENHFFSPNLLKMVKTLENKEEKAKFFIEKYYPEIQLPFLTNLIKRTNISSKEK